MSQLNSPDAVLASLIGLAEAAELLPTKPHTPTMKMWATVGFQASDGRRVHLKTVCVGRSFFTTAEWTLAFVRDIADARRRAVIGGAQ